jgi:hypothetical protein
MTEQEIDGEQLVAETWPKDGPHSPEALSSAADALYELVRYLNYATDRSGTTLPYAGYGYRLTGNLAGAAGMQPQLYHQLGRWAASLADDPRLRHYEHRDDPSVATRETLTASNAFAEAARLAEQLQAALGAAQSALSPLEHEEGQ